MTEEHSQPLNKLPTTLDWYRQAANWFVGLSTGAIAGSIVFIDKLKLEPLFMIILFVLGNIAFFATVFAGIYFYWWLITYGNIKERADALRSKMTVEQDGTENHTNLSSELREANNKLARSLDRLSCWHRVLKYAFPVGLITFAVMVLAYAIDIRTANSKFLIVDAPAITNISTSHSRDLLLLNEVSGDSWHLVADNNVLRWKKIRAEY